MYVRIYYDQGLVVVAQACTEYVLLASDARTLDPKSVLVAATATPAPPKLVREPRRRCPWWLPLETPCWRHVFTRLVTRAKKNVLILHGCFKSSLVILLWVE